MILSWRKRRTARRAARENQEANHDDMLLLIPNHFRCPISLELMKDPVTLSTGFTYDRESIERWIEDGNRTCPVTNNVLSSAEPIPNHSIRKMIQDWCVDHRSYGIERISTPRIPVSSDIVLEILAHFKAACKGEDQAKCQQLVAKIKNLANESERNRRCIMDNGAGNVLSAAFEFFSRDSFLENSNILGEILSASAILLPVEITSKSHFGSDASLCCIVWFLNNADLSSRRNAVLLLREIITSHQENTDATAKIQGIAEALVKQIREPICPSTTKASLTIIYHMITSSYSKENMRVRFVENRLVSLLLEILVDAERSICEKALGVLDGICQSDEGREKAINHGLAVPVLVKKILRVSDLATEFSISILWKLSKHEKIEAKAVLTEALQVGAFQKLLILLQVGCADRTKENATELLKLLNLQRSCFECIDSSDLKNIKRPF